MLILRQFFFHWRISIQEHIFCYWHFLITSFFKSLYLLKWCPIFDTSPLTQFSKFNNFLWVCWFLGKNLSNFVPPIWKLHYPYCHSARHFFCSCISVFTRVFHVKQFPFNIFWYTAITQLSINIYIARLVFAKKWNCLCLARL